MINVNMFLILCFIFVFLWKFQSGSVEKYTPEHTKITTALLEWFKDGDRENKTFSDYLDVLSVNNNTFDGLISKSVFNKLKGNKNLSLNDLLNETTE